MLRPGRYAEEESARFKLRRDPNCTRCVLNETAQFVCLLGKGPEPCDIMVIGEAPGKREDDSGKPFVGDAGQYLDEILEDTGLSRSRMYITNAVSCRPPQNRTPTKREIKACSHWLDAQFKAVKPKYVLLLGNTALFAITGKAGIKRARGKPFTKDGVIYLPAYHPSYILRGNMRDDPIFRNDLKTFKSIIEGGGVPEEKKLDIKIVTNEKVWQELLRDLSGTVSFDIETTGLYPWAKGARVVSIGFGTRHTQYLIPTHLFDLNKKRLRELTRTLEDCIVCAHNGKFDALWIWVHYGERWRIDFDTMIAHYLLDENTFHGLKELAQRFCDAPNWDVEGETKKEWSPLLIKYHAHDLFYTRKLKFLFARQLAEDPMVAQVFYKIMMPCVEIFTEAEYEGIYIDIERMGEVEKTLRATMRDREKQLRKYGDINWGSPKQVADLLYVKMKLPVVERTKKGAPSAGESALKRLDHPMVKALLDYRGAKQQLSFFIEGWQEYIIGARLHPSFKLTGTVTGRLSCEHPNLQQVPRDPLIRTLVGAPPGWVLIEADLSQIELRIAAELAHERALIEAFEKGKDPHWLTVMNELRRSGGQRDIVLSTATKARKKPVRDFDDAIDILLEIGPDASIELDERWKELRKKAKAVNFGYLFGMWWKKFKEYARNNYDVIVSDEQAQESRKAFFDLYRDFPDWHKRQRAFARRNGYVRTLSGRKRRLPDAMQGEDSPSRGEAERQAINSPVQSFANEMNLMALIQLRNEFPRSIYRPVGTVHDSILAIARVEHAEEIAKRTLEVMRHPKLLDELDIDLKIPIDADVKIGPWGKGKGLKKWLEETSSKSVSQRSTRGGAVSTRTTSSTRGDFRREQRRDRLRLAA
jgi:uracil-DNA glycosylase family 4